MLKGQAKKDYQREYMRGYMRDRRLKMRVVKTPQLRPYEPIDDGKPEVITIDADGNPVYEEG